MKPKGIKFIELIGDKIFLAVFALIFLAVVALQFVGGGNTVQLGNQDNVAIDQAYEQLIRLAKSKKAQMDMPDVAPDAPTDPPTITMQMATVLANPVVSAPTPPLVRSHADLGSGAVVSGGDEIDRYALPHPPAPGQAVAAAFGGALDPFVLEAVPELRQSLISDAMQQPYDMFAVSVQADFDVAAYREILSADPDGPGELSALPRQWWQSRLEILDVEVWRREVFPNGERGEAELLPPPPGMASLRDALASDMTVGQLNQYVRFAEQPENSRQIRQPLFYRLIAGENWTPPISLSADAVDPRATELAEVRRRIAEARTGSAQNPDAVRALQARESELVTALQSEGIDPSTGRRLGADPRLSNPPPRVRDIDGVLSVWSHDVTAEPGATYEYQVRLVFPNPLVGYEQFIASDLQELAQVQVLKCEPSAWSAPVTVPERAYMFVDRAVVPESGAVGFGRPYAQVALYRFYYGYWRRGESRVQAGDAISAPISISQPLPLWRIEGGDAQSAGEIAGPIEADSGAFLLDIIVEPSPAPAGPGGREQLRNAAVIGGADGSISVRRTGDSVSQSLRQELQASAEAAEGAAIARPSQQRAQAGRGAGQALARPN